MAVTVGMTDPSKCPPDPTPVYIKAGSDPIQSGVPKSRAYTVTEKVCHMAFAEVAEVSAIDGLTGDFSLRRQRFIE